MRGPTYTERQARAAIAASDSYAAALRELGMCVSGGGGRVLKKWAAIWDIPVDHFDPSARHSGLTRHAKKPLVEVLVEGSTYCRTDLKARLYDEGLKERRCEACAQGELWRGQRMALILDHVNGTADDNRLANLRILCPNCAATLPTHCARKLRRKQVPCAGCGKSFAPRYRTHRYCSRACGQRAPRRRSRGPRSLTTRSGNG